MIYHDVEGLVEGFNWYYDQLLLFFKMKVYSEHAFLEQDPIRMDITTSSTCSINLKGKYWQWARNNPNPKSASLRCISAAN